MTVRLLRVPSPVMFDCSAPVTMWAAGTVSYTFDPLIAERAEALPTRFEADSVFRTIRFPRLPTFVIRF